MEIIYRELGSTELFKDSHYFLGESRGSLQSCENAVFSGVAKFLKKRRKSSSTPSVNGKS
jgi:hypothetical protein